MKPDISVVIPTYNRGDILINTIKDALCQTYKNFEIIVIDQTTNNTKTYVDVKKIKDKRLRYFHTKPPSLPAARNYALEVARSPIVLYLDDDVRLNERLIEWHLKAHSKKNVAAVAGRVMQEGFPILDNVLLFDECAVSKGVFTATKADFTNAFPGGNHSLKVSVAKKLGGYDTRYYGNAFREESDMSLRIVRAGYKIFYEPKAELLHLAEPTGGTRTKRYKSLYDNPMFYRNEIFFTFKSVKIGKIPTALLVKFKEYCLHYGKKKIPKRSVLFMLGIIGAIKRLLLDKQIVQNEFN